MTPVLITRTEGLLEKQFDGLIDMTDWAARPADQRRGAFLSRALAALCIKSLAKVDVAIAAAAVTDGFHDNGIDAIYFDQVSDALLIVQSHWSKDGSTPITSEDTGKLAQGILDILSLRIDRFNDKIKAKEAEIKAAVYSERALKFIIITAHTATQPTAPHATRIIDDLVSELNTPVPTAESKHFDQAGIYKLITSESKSQKIKLSIALTDWGVIDKPFLAYYGRLHVNEIAQWWAEHGNTLFTENLRLFYPSSDVNNALSNTLGTDPDYFWYFNNGITIICDSLGKSPVGSPGRSIGLFTCDGASVVNGAQTVGTIGHKWKLVPGSPIQEESGRNAWVQIRIISLQYCPPEFGRLITRAANLQNAVGYREFAAMDPCQHRLATEFALDKRRYAYKQGEISPKGNEGCDIVEATQAIACGISISLAVQTKRNLGQLWADTQSPPYTEIFNEKTAGESVWRSVKIMRAVDNELQLLKTTDAPKADLIAIHLNRLILHLVFQDTSVRSLRYNYSREDECLAAVVEATKTAFADISRYIDQNHKDEYLANLSKNTKRCETLVEGLYGSGQIGQTGSLFQD